MLLEIGTLLINHMLFFKFHVCSYFKITIFRQNIDFANMKSFPISVWAFGPSVIGRNLDFTYYICAGGRSARCL